MERRDKVNYYLDLADVVSQRGTCLRKRYGAVIVKNDEVIATILQDFVSIFWKKFGDYVRFHGYVFNLEDGDEEDYVKWRYKRSRHAIYTYAAKENHVYADYEKMTEEEMKELLKKNYLWENLKANTNFFKGTCVRANARSN